MANIITQHKIVDDGKRAIIKIVGLCDSPLGNAVIIDASTLFAAKNTNGFIMTGNNDPLPNYRTAIRSMTMVNGQANGYIRATWAGTGLFANTTDAFVFPPGITRYGAENGDISVPSNVPYANGTGDIVLQSVGSMANVGFTMIVDLRKYGEDFDPGRFADPSAFNR